jgi:tartrate/fumarate subfamily iron-sulfur-dependent hydro-lyase alpha chain/tartrate/fumarate subfamily iron-sulfur-dependent hydro-lyase beta chain
VKLGKDSAFTGCDIKTALNKAVSNAYKKYYLRKSIVSDPIERKNTKDNTPANVDIELVKGSGLEISLLPKGGGSENASALKMLPPSAGWQGVKDFVLSAIKEKGANACPPLIIGVGIGGDFSSVAKIAKQTLLRKIGSKNKNAFYAKKEKELLNEINKLNIGPMGLGGKTTALAVFIDAKPCHIASLPAAVSIQCHSCRRAGQEPAKIPLKHLCQWDGGVDIKGLHLTTDDLLSNIKSVKAGDRVYLSGTIYTARDAAHKRIVDILDKGGHLPFDLNNSAIYYCGPAPTKPKVIIGACGPTTSSRMDVFTPQMLKNGVKILIGKGARSQSVVSAIKENAAVYFVATGGVAALLSKTVIKAKIIAFKDLGAEAVYKLEVKDMPLIVGVDAFGKDVFRDKVKSR